MFRRCACCGESIVPSSSPGGQPLQRERLPDRPTDHDVLPYPSTIWLHSTCEALMYDAYSANGWSWDDLEDYFRMGDSNAEHHQHTEPPLGPAPIDGFPALEQDGNCAPFAWSHVLGREAVLRHMQTAPPLHWDGAHMVRNLADWCQLGGGQYSLGSPLPGHPPLKSTTGLPFFAVYNRGGVQHVDCVFLLDDSGSYGHMASFCVCSSDGKHVVPRDEFIQLHMHSGGLVWYPVVAGPSRLSWAELVALPWVAGGRKSNAASSSLF